MLIEDFGQILRKHGIRHGAGVPCSFFTPLVNYMDVEPSLDYVSATSEGEAVAIAAGLVSAGKPAFALMQNSGLGNAVNPITSMLHIYQMPVVLLVSHRGEPGITDEPQHALMGEITMSMAELCGLRTHRLVPEQLDQQLQSALTDQVPSAFVVPKGGLTQGPKARPLELTVRSGPATPASSGTFSPQLMREQALQALLPLLNRGLEGGTARPDTPAVVCTTGKLSRELFELDDHAHDRINRFYMVGSMGCAAGFGLGVARGVEKRPVIVLDGDGALLMKLGSLATIGNTAPANLHHVVFDNGAHDSTGGQPTPSASVDFAAAAAACGYRHSMTADTEADMVAALNEQLDMEGPTLLRMMIHTGSRKDLGRPDLSPKAGWQRFRRFLTGEQAHG